MRKRIIGLVVLLIFCLAGNVFGQSENDFLISENPQ